jgi:SAM-dependent methyltransferase
VLELGVGTGALALALAAAGWDVTGLDASSAMLSALEAKARGRAVRGVLGDAGDPTTWPTGPFDVVLAAWNLITNLDDRRAQAAMCRGAAAVLAPGGTVVVEAFVPAPPPRRERRVSLGSVDRMVRIHTDADPARGIVDGRHVELGDEGVVVRGWRLCWIRPEELDELAAAAGLVLEARHAGWRSEPFVADESASHVSRYRRRPR